MARFVARIVGAALLKPETYEEVEADRTATPQAMGVVALATVASGLGVLMAGWFEVIVTLAGALFGWIVLASLIWLVGTQLLPEKQTEADLGQLLRTIGFAASPGLLLVLQIIPLVGAVVAFVVGLWQLATTVMAVRQALDYESTARTVVVCLAGWVPYAVLWFGTQLLFGITSIELG